MSGTNVCKKCESTNHVVINEEIVKERSFLVKLIMFGLIFVPVIGWGIFIYLWFKKPSSETVVSSVCQNCGNKVLLSVS